MTPHGWIAPAIVLLAFEATPATWGQGAKNPAPDGPAFEITSNLVFLDVTVLDKRGNPVVHGLTRDDFTITEDKKPQKLFSFEGPEEHAGSGPGGTAPATILVLDTLNSSFEDTSYIRYEVGKFLEAQPATLATRTEMLVLGEESLELVQGYTRSRDDLQYALKHLPAWLPYKHMNAAFGWERVVESLDALQQIALQDRGMPGRKNVIWVGHGGPGLYMAGIQFQSPAAAREVEHYVHATSNLMVESRTSLYVIYPGLKVRQGIGLQPSALMSDIALGDSDPFAGDVNFGVFVNVTGGKLYFNRNDVDAEMAKSLVLGRNYYTLTYQPHDVPPDGKFRRIRVSVKNREYRVVTKAGYFAPEAGQPVPRRTRSIVQLAQAMRARIPYSALDVQVAKLVQHPDTHSMEVLLELRNENLNWQPVEGGTGSSARFLLGEETLDKDGNSVGWKVQRLRLNSMLEHPEQEAEQKVPVKVTVRMPRRARSIRVVMETEGKGLLGSAEIAAKEVATAPAQPTPTPALAPARTQPN